MNAVTDMIDLLPHEASEFLPMMEANRFAELKADIKANGLLHNIVLCDGKILDGRNRYRACLEAGVAPSFSEFIGDPFAYVWSANGQRRDLSVDQRYLIWKKLAEKSQEWQSKQAELAEQANRKRSEAALGNQNASKDRDKNSVPTNSGDTEIRDRRGERERETATVKAEQSQTNRGAVERMDRLERERPDLAEKVRKGEITATEALRLLKKSEVATKVAALPQGKYRVIYADPPWKYNDERGGLGSGDGASTGIDRASTAARDHYPTMSMTELAALDVKSLAADDSVLLCWATFPLLPGALDVVKAWGFTYKTAFVWNKGRGSFGHYHKADAELLLVATRGSCMPDSEMRISQILPFPRADHSAKPLEVRLIIDREWIHGPRIELFNRGGAPNNWVVWGNESAAEDAA